MSQAKISPFQLQQQPAANAIELCGVHKSYDHFVAVDHLYFSIREGSVYGLLGPNGAGKTSTIRMMVGITLPDDGHVRLFGEPFHREQLRRVGYLPEERGLYKRMKVVDHLILLGRLHNLSERDARRRSREWCERLQLAEWMYHK
ncbi:MAG TPA: ATP-binding cassette domain-containing protein, partial [Candidatus Binataceae bacterium]|nr:ATP-binding cassette domain-containing protein [Candidatus Binataceae bacterium]